MSTIFIEDSISRRSNNRSHTVIDKGKLLDLFETFFIEYICKKKPESHIYLLYFSKRRHNFYNHTSSISKMKRILHWNSKFLNAWHIHVHKNNAMILKSLRKKTVL